MTEEQVEQTSKALMTSILGFYKDPENVKRFEEWLRQSEQSETGESV